MRRVAVVTAVLCAGAGAAFLVGAVASWPHDGPDFRVTSRPSASTVIPPITARLGADVPVTSSAIDAQRERVTPVAISVPALSIDMPLVAEGLNTKGGLELPDTSLEAVWYRYGGVPGQAGEAALIAAHVDNAVTGIGPFARLRDVEPGASVRVALSDGSLANYAVVGAEQRHKRGLDFAELLNASPGMLMLVTCGGRFDATTGHYEDNVIVWAVPADSSWGSP